MKKTIKEIVDEVIDPEAEIALISDVAKIQEEKSSGDHFPIGFKIFSDIMKGGVTEGDLIVISGKTGHGKTTFAQTLGYHFAKLGLPQLWFSYEIQVLELWTKFKEMGVDPDFIGYAPLKLKSGNIEWIEHRIDEAITKFNTKVIIIDHLGFLTPKMTLRESENFSAYLGDITRQLKFIAIQKNVCIFLLAHVRKTQGELDTDDLAHSVGIGQEADFVFMVERERLSAKMRLDTQGELFSQYSKISLVKNRRTGISKYLKCQLKNGRLQETAPVYTPEIVIDYP